MNQQWRVGIDPGQSGALAATNGDEVFIFDYTDTHALQDWLVANRLHIKIAVLEKVSSMPKQGVASTFTFGVNYGWWLGVLEILGIPFKLVRPQEWQKGMALPKDRKARKKAIYTAARRLYPFADLTGSRGGIKDGRSDALIIMHQMANN